MIVGGSIGCNARCDFCSSWMIAGRTLHRSPLNVVDEMAWLRERYGPGLVYHIVNPLFNANRDWLLELCAEMGRRGPFPSVCMPDFCLDREMVRAMKRAGVFMVMMGLEFADSKLRVLRGKREGDAVTAYTLCSDEGIITRAFLMLGRLGMSWQDVKAEMDALDRMPFRADQLRINFEVPFPGTKIARSIGQSDVVSDESRWTTEEVVYRTDMSPEEWQSIRYEITHRYHFGGNQQRHYWQQVIRFPELAPVYDDFLRRLDASVASHPRGPSFQAHVQPAERQCAPGKPLALREEAYRKA